MVTLDFSAQRSTTSVWSKNSHSTALASLGKRLRYKFALVHAAYSCKHSVFGGIFTVKRAVTRESRLKMRKKHAGFFPQRAIYLSSSGDIARMKNVKSLFQCLQWNFHPEQQALMWLKCDKDKMIGALIVSLLWCY